MTSNTRYCLKRHHKFEHGGRKYAADLETNGIFQITDVEWDILDHYDFQTQYHIVEELKEKYKVTTIFEGIERLERLGEQGSLLRPIDEATSRPVTDWKQAKRKPRLLVPFHFTKEKASLDYITNLNRYELLAHLAKFASLETLIFSEAGNADQEWQEIKDFGKGIKVRHIEVEKSDTFDSTWYAMDGYDGILLLSQHVTDDLLYYHIPDIPIVHCIEGNPKWQNATLETFLNVYAFQRPKDSLVIKNSWLKTWLGELDLPEKRMHVIPDGIDVVEPIGKALAKQHTASLFDNPMFAEHPVVGLISGFESRPGAELICAFAHANPHVAIFVYDTFLSKYNINPPSNVVIFSADDQETCSILPIFFQALDLVCFPAIPGTPLSLVLEAMAYGSPCIALSQYGLPEEVKGAGVAVKSEWDGSGHFHVSISQLSETVNQCLVPCGKRTKYEAVAKSLMQRYTWERTAQNIVQLFAGNRRTQKDNSATLRNLFPPIFCRHYDPGTRTTTACAYQTRTHGYESLETALAGVLSEHHTPAEVQALRKHFQEEGSTLEANRCALEMVFPASVGNPIPPDSRPGRKEINRDEKQPSE